MCRKSFLDVNSHTFCKKILFIFFFCALFAIMRYYWRGQLLTRASYPLLKFLRTRSCLRMNLKLYWIEGQIGDFHWRREIYIRLLKYYIIFTKKNQKFKMTAVFETAVSANIIDFVNSDFAEKSTKSPFSAKSEFTNSIISAKVIYPISTFLGVCSIF